MSDTDPKPAVLTYNEYVRAQNALHDTAIPEIHRAPMPRWPPDPKCSLCPPSHAGTRIAGSLHCKACDERVRKEEAEL